MADLGGDFEVLDNDFEVLGDDFEVVEDQGPPLSAASPAAQQAVSDKTQRIAAAKNTIAKLRSGQQIDQNEASALMSYLNAGRDMESRPERVDPYAPIASAVGLDPKIVRGANAAGFEAMTLGAPSGIGGRFNPAAAEQHRQELEQFRGEHPYMAAGSMVAGSLPMALAAPNTLPAALLTGAAGGVMSSRAENLGDLAQDVGTGAGVGALMYGASKPIGAALGWAAGKLGIGAGKALQQPQRAYEGVAERLASPEDVVGASARPSSGSKLQQGLKDIVSGSELAAMGPEVGGAAMAAEKSIGGVGAQILDKPLAALSGPERGALMRAMVIGLERRGLKVTPEAVAGSFDDLLRAAGKEPSEVTAREAIRLVNQRDPAFAQQLAVNASKRWGPIRAGMDVDPREAQMVGASQGMLDDIAAGKQNRFNVRGQQGGAAQLPKDTPAPVAEDVQAAAAARLKAKDEAAFAAREAMNKTNPGAHRGGWATNERGDTAIIQPDAARAQRQQARAAFQQSPQGKAEMAAQMAEVNDQAAARGVNPSNAGMTPEELGVQRQMATEPWQPFDAEKAKALTGTDDPALAGSIARDRLRKINAGKGKLNNIGTTAGLLSMATGYQLPAALGTARLLASNATAGAGRFLERSGNRSVQAFARRWAEDPTLIKALAQRPDKLGSAAKFVLEGAEASGQQGLKSRLFVLSMQPWFREYAAQQQASGQAP
jgi:hypothetical protein